MLEAISGYVTGFLAEKLMQKRVRSWVIALVLTVASFLVYALYHLLFLKESVAEIVSPVWLVLPIFTGLFLLLWLVVIYYYGREKRAEVR